METTNCKEELQTPPVNTVVDEKKIIKEDKIDFKLCFSLNLNKSDIKESK